MINRKIIGVCGTVAGILAVAVSAGAEVPALQQLADRLDRQLTQILQRGAVNDPVVAVVVEGDASIVGREGRIAQELERLLLYRMESGTVVGRAIPLGAGGAPDIEEARDLGAEWLLRCVVGVEQGTIHLTADLTFLHVPFWDRLVNPVPQGAQKHMFVSTKADEEVLVLLGKSRAPPPLGSFRLAEVLYLPNRVLDLGLGDLDGVKGAELVLLYQEAIEVYSLEGTPPRRLVTHSLTQLPESAIRTRDPTGSLLVVDFNLDGRWEVFFKLFNRGMGEILSWTGSDLRSLRELGKVPLCAYRKNKRAQVLYGAPEPGTNHYLPEVEVMDINLPSGRKVALDGPFTTLRCWQTGAEEEPWILSVDLQGKMLWLDGNFKVRQMQPGVGAGAGVVDLDGDNLPELVLSDPVWPGEADSVRVISRGDVIWQTREVVGGVVAVAGGDPDGRGKFQAVLAAVEPSGKASRIYLLGR